MRVFRVRAIGLSGMRMSALVHASNKEQARAWFAYVYSYAQLTILAVIEQ